MSKQKMPEVYINFGLCVRARRKELHLTQEFAAKRLRISRGSLANIEVGRQQVMLHDLFVFADALEINVKKFFQRLRP